MDWVDLISSEPTEKREDDMSNLAVAFATWMRPPLPPGLFANPRCPPIPTAIKEMGAEVHHS